MIATLRKGRGARGLLEYLSAERDSSGKVRPMVVDLGGTLPGQDVREMARAMGALHAARPTVSRYVAHAMLSWDATGGDAPDLPTQADMMADHMRDLGFDDYRIWSHGDHVHGIASRTKEDGSVVSESLDWKRAEASCRSLEIKYGLHRIASSPNLEPASITANAATPQPVALTHGEMGIVRTALAEAEKRGGELNPDLMPAKPQLADAVLAAREAALLDGATVGAFVRACHRAGVEVRPNWSPDTGKVSGLSFFMADQPDVEVSASKISRGLSWANMQKGGLSYEFGRDGAELRTAGERAEGRRPGRTAGRDTDAGNPELRATGGGVPPAGSDAGGPLARGGLREGADGGHAGPDAVRVEPDGIRNGGGAGPATAGRGIEHGGPGRTAGSGGGSHGTLVADLPPQAGRGGDERRADGEGVAGGTPGRGEPATQDGSGDRGHAGGSGGSGPEEAGRPAGDGGLHGPSHESLVSLAGVSDARLRLTAVAVAQAVKALGEPFYVVGILPPRGTPPEQARTMHTLHKTYSAEQLTGEPVMKYLRAMNAKGHDIYFKPASPSEGMRPALVLLDDLNPDALERMRRDGMAPALEVTSSPGNHQAWVRVGTAPLPVDVVRQVARDLAETYGGDPLAAKGEQFGRLPGFTNRKPKRILENGGKPPFARVIEAVGKVARGAGQVVASAIAALRAGADRESARAAAARERALQAARERQGEQAVSSVSRHMRASGTRQGAAHGLSEVDFAAACGALRDGHSPDAIKDALRALSPDLESRHPRVDDYLDRTVTKAQAAVSSSPGYRR
jgi:hypothetical protein